MSTILRLAAIDTELDAIATRIEALRRRRETLLTERRGIVAACTNPATWQPRPNRRKESTR